MENIVGFEWVAAVVTPWAISPHPNFRTTSASTVELIALLAENRFDDFVRYMRLQVEDEEQETVATAFQESLVADTQRSAADRLTVLASQTSSSIGCRVAAILFAAVAYSELDYHELAISGLIDCVRSIDSDFTKRPPASAMLAKSILLLQSAIRKIEFGDGNSANTDILAALASLENMEGAFEEFNVSQSLSWNSDVLQADIASATRLRCLSVQSQLAPVFDDTWVTLVKSRPTWPDIKVERRSLIGLQKYLGEIYDYEFRQPSRSVRLMGGDPAMTPLESALTNAELSGDFSEIDSSRSNLARMRMLRAQRTPDRYFLCSDALRLFRHACDQNGLSGAIDWLQVNGPNSVLADSATKALDVWKRRGRGNQCDLITLQGGSEFLTVEQKRRSIQYALNYQHQESEPGEASRSRSDWKRLEMTWRLIAKMLPDSGLDSLVSYEVLQLLAAETRPYVLGPTINRIIDSIDWNEVSESNRDAWLDWSNENLDTDYGVEASSIQRKIGAEKRHRLDSPRGLSFVIDILDSWEEYESDKLLVSEAVGICESAAQAILQEASENVTTKGDFNVGAIIAAVSVRTSSHKLWTSLVELLRNPQVSPEEKATTLDQLIREDVSDSGLPVEKIAAIWRQIGVVRESPFTASDPYDLQASLLRFGLKYAIVRLDEYIEQVTEMACGSSNAKLQAIRSLYVNEIPEQASDWYISQVLQLSRDRASKVASNAAYCLARKLPESALQSVAIRRLTEIVNGEGYILQIRVLEGIQQRNDLTGVRDYPILWRAINATREHPSDSVRRLANQIAQNR